MSKNNPKISTDFEQTRAALAAAQTRIAELEATLARSQPSSVPQPPLDRYRTTLDNLLESCQIIGFDWRYLYLNDAAAIEGRRPKEELLGHTVMEMYPGIETTELFAVMRKSMEARTEEELEFEFTYPDQSRAWFKLRVQPVPEGIFMLTINISDQKRTEIHIRKLNRTLLVSSHINQAIVRTRDIGELFDQSCAIAVEQGAFKMAWIGLMSADAKQIQIVAHAGGNNDAKLMQLSVLTVRENGLTGSVLRTGQRVVSNNIDSDPRMSMWQDDMRRLDYHSTAALPLLVEGQVRGMFYLYAAEYDFFDEEELKLVDEMAADIAFAMAFAEQQTNRQQAQEAARRYAKRLETVHQIDTEIIASSSIKTLLEVIVKHMRQLIPCPRVGAALYDPITDETVIYALDVNAPTQVGEGVRTTLPDGWFNHFNGSTVRIIDDLRLVEHEHPNYKYLIQEGILSSLQVLLKDRNQPIGLFALSSDLPGFFTNEHREIAADVGNQLAIAIRQLRMTETLGQHAAELERNNIDLHRAEDYMHRYAERIKALHEIDRGLIQGDSIDDLIQVTLTHLRHLIPCQQASVILIDHATKEGVLYVINYNRESVFKEGVRFPLPPDAFEGYDERHLRVFEDIRLEPETNLRAQRLASEGLISGLSVFLVDQDVPIAALSLLADTKGFFTAEYQEIAIEIANQLTIAIRQMRLSDELEQRVIARTAELYDAKQRVEAILNSSIDGVVLAYLNTGIQQTNDTFNSLFACADNAYLGKPLTSLVAEANREQLEQTIAAVIAEQQGKTIEVEACDENANKFDAEMSISPMIKTDGGGQGFVCRISDITERKAQERQLRFHASLQQNVMDAVIATDLQLNIQSWNQAAERIYGWKMEEVIGKSITILQSSLPESETSNDAYQALLEKGAWTAEVIHHDRYGNKIDILSSVVLFKDDQGAPLGIVGVNHDISQQKRLLKELDEQRIFLRSVIDVSPNMIFVKDYDAHFVLVNPMVAEVYNTTVEALIGKSDADFNSSPEEVANFLEADREVINTGKRLVVEEPVTNAKGETHWFQTIKVPIISVDGKSKYVLGISSDITERKNSEEVLREAFKKEKELGELKSRFVSMASHEFRTPLATILAVTETLTAYRDRMNNEQIGQRLSKIQGQVDHLKDIIDEVLQLAQMQAKRVIFNPSRVDVDAMCQSVLDEFQSRPNIQHELIYTCRAQFKDAYLDKRLMRQIISNLMSNAIKYSPEGKTIHVNLDEQDNMLIFKIEDEGIGIPEYDLKHLFEPFHRAENVGSISGTGLGLVITKESVELHGGTIAVESQVNIGSTFTVKIPLRNIDVVPPAAPKS